MPVEVIDNSEEVLEAIERAKKAALKAIGATAASYAKEDCPVNTGRLRGSINWATSDESGAGEEPAGADDYTPRGTPEEGAAYIGTNVEYAPYVEFGDTKHFTVGNAHFLRDAAQNHSDEYRQLVDNIMRNA